MASTSRISGRALARLLPAVRERPGPVYAALADAISALVLDGRVVAGAQLPSERELAGTLQLSRATITAAYDALRERGFLASRSGSGTYVSVPRHAHRSHGPRRWYAPGTDMIDLSSATLPAPHDALASAASAALTRLPAYECGDGYHPAGIAELRSAVAARFSARGVPTTADQIMITSGALHGIDLLMRQLIGPGDRVLTELPTYPGVLDAVRAHGARLVPVPMQPDGGWQVEQLEATLRQTAPRLAYLVPDFQNPTGTLIDTDARRRVLRAARRAGTTVIVDEAFVDLGHGVEPATPAAALDSSVITVGSLSKPVWAGLRVGWVRASAELVNRLATLRASIDVGGAVLDQLIATDLLADLDEIAAARVGELVVRRDGLLAAIGRELPGWRCTPPQGGMSLWINLDAALSTHLSVAAAGAGVLIVPGSRFGIDGTLERFLRLPFTAPTDQLELAVTRLATVWRGLHDDRPSEPALVVA